jgi:non-canonical poly(A) RNA polymerase PAPD5/7
VGAPTQPAKQAVRYSPLHHNVEEFCVRVVPTEEERKYKQLVIDLCVRMRSLLVLQIEAWSR